MMEYMITRTSLRDNEQPYEGAYQKTILKIERQASTTIKQLDNGSYVPIGGGAEIGKVEVSRWFITVNSIEELMTLHIQCDEWLIVGTNTDYDPPQVFIEIYDGYRE